MIDFQSRLHLFGYEAAFIDTQKVSLSHEPLGRPP
jgi:hypothetical protein